MFCQLAEKNSEFIFLHKMWFTHMYICLLYIYTDIETYSIDSI